MSKIRLLLALIVASLCSVTLSARTAPTLPTAQTLESGKTYYLYNVGSDRFLYQSGNNSYAYAYTDKGAKVKVAAVNGTQYTLQFVSDDYYKYLTSSNNYPVRVDVSSRDYTETDNRFTITLIDGGYTLQRVYNAVDTLYLGYRANDNSYVYSDVVASGNIVWQFLDADEAARFVAKRNLYRALESAEGYTVDAYDAVYTNDESTNDDIQAAADKLNKAVDATTSVNAPDWADYKTLIEMSTSDQWRYYSNGSYESREVATGNTIYLAATVTVDGDATMCFNYRMNNWGFLEVYLDDVLQYTIHPYEGNSDQRYFVEMTSGRHTVTWKFTGRHSSSSSYAYMSEIGVESTPTMTVSLGEAGSLGTEVLYKTDHIANVRKLIVSGPMNSDDWGRIQMMTSLFTLDLSDATADEVPDYQFCSSSSPQPFFHAIKLPKNLKRIGTRAFYNTVLEDITFSDSLTTIGYDAFRGARIKEAILPETVTTFELDGDYSHAFAENQSLTKASFPAAAVSIPNRCFDGCYALQPFDFPEGVTSIGYRAFYNCYNFDSSIPSTVKTIDDYAFYSSGITNVVLTEGVSVGDYAFQYSDLKSIVLPTTFYSDRYYMLSNCDSLTDVTFQSPTVVVNKRSNMLGETSTMSKVNLHVPDYLVNHYKQDNYWYNCNVVGFPTTDIKNWVINNNLELKEGERIQGSPNLTLNAGNYLTISGETAMTIDTLTVGWGYQNYYEPWRSQVLMTGDNISIEGKFRYSFYTYEKEWYFLTLPFDFKVSDLQIADGASYAIRYYDGATRATDGTSGNWKNWPTDSIIPAGTGFIYQTSKTTASYFTSQDNDSKQYGVSNKIFTKALAANPSETSSDKGWNFIGNPWACYYNIHKLNFVAPITVWNYNNKSYKAYSVIDDDYAILPNEAFFVQCPDDVNSISFPIDGRQLDDKIESQNGAKPASTARQRRLINLQVMGADSLADVTRVVVNSLASLDYETSCDASKFMSLDRSVPQLYTIGTDGTQYAINERPEGDGTVALGLKVARQGTYTIAATRSDIGSAILTDHELGQQADLSQGGYTFTADAGTYNDRFTLSLNGGGVTAIGSVESGKAGVSVGDGAISVSGKATVYGIDGRKVAEVSDGSVSVPAGVYIVRSGKETVKVNVK